jgi:hypothetical protein
MIWFAAFIRSPLGRLAVMAGVVALLMGWGSLERMGRQAANARAAAAEAEALESKQELVRQVRWLSPSASICLL